jgi:peroxiredoxin Q/BCP|tara:strand:- start:257 stop:535 length:279 start_codon:yes stop_codon:yes gene_type:complete
VILGASFDTIEEQKAFAEKESFPYALLSDPDRAVGQLYGVAREPDHDFAGWPRRASFLIDPSGVVAKVYDFRDKPDLAEHAATVLTDLQELS